MDCVDLDFNFSLFCVCVCVFLQLSHQLGVLVPLRNLRCQCGEGLQGHPLVRHLTQSPKARADGDVAGGGGTIKLLKRLNQNCLYLDTLNIKMASCLLLIVGEDSGDQQLALGRKEQRNVNNVCVQME